MNKVEPPYWELFSHDADMGVRGVGRTLEEAFAQAGIALTGVATNPQTVKPASERVIKCQAPNLDILFYDWLNSLIYEMSKDKFFFSKFEVQIKNLRLAAKIWGEAVDIERHTPAVEVKGATFTQLKVEQNGDRWTAQCVVDV